MPLAVTHFPSYAKYAKNPVFAYSDVPQSPQPGCANAPGGRGSPTRGQGILRPASRSRYAA